MMKRWMYIVGSVFLTVNLMACGSNYVKVDLGEKLESGVVQEKTESQEKMESREKTESQEKIEGQETSQPYVVIKNDSVEGKLSQNEKAGPGVTKSEVDEANQEQGADLEHESQLEDDSWMSQQSPSYVDVLIDVETCREKRIYAKKAENQEEISLVFAGDILFDDSYAIMSAMKQRGKGIEGSISAELLGEMRNADIFMVNNEFPYTDRGTPQAGKTYTFRAKPQSASYLKDMGADLVSLANNHVFDYGEVSLTDSIDTLNAIDMPYVGAGRNIEEASSPVYYIVNDKKIAFLSATQIERLATPDTKGATETTPGVFRCLDNTRLLKQIREVKEKCDYLVVYIHWGTEGTEVPDHWQLEQAPQMAEAGADLIIGDHPHVLQPITYIGNVPVVYSLGNYLFNSKTRDTCLVKVVLGKDGLKTLQFIPAVQKSSSVQAVSGEEKDRILQYMRSISGQIVIDGDGYMTPR